MKEKTHNDGGMREKVLAKNNLIGNDVILDSIGGSNFKNSVIWCSEKLTNEVKVNLSFLSISL